MAEQVFGKYVAPLLAGIVFVCVGVKLVFFPPSQVRSSRAGFRCFGIVVMVFAGSIAAFLLLGPSPWRRVREVSTIVQMQPSDLVSAEILPARGNDPQLINAPASITGQKALKILCEALHSAEPWQPSHPHAVWACDLRLNTANDHYRCGVHRTDHNGVLIHFSSRGASGVEWSMATDRCDRLGDVLESFVQTHRGPDRVR
jgi:hypothetical protein